MNKKNLKIIIKLNSFIEIDIRDYNNKMNKKPKRKNIDWKNKFKFNKMKMKNKFKFNKIIYKWKRKIV